MAEGVEDEDLADGSAKAETKDIGADGRVQPYKGHGRRELVWRKREEVRKVRRGQKVAGCQKGRKEILGNHHLGTRVWTMI